MDKVAAPTPNLLLDEGELPRFEGFTPALIDPALDGLLARAEAVLAEVTQDGTAPSWDTVVVPLELATEKLGRAWGVVGHLIAVADSPDLREAYNRNLPRMTQFWTRLGQDVRLFAKYKAIQADPAFPAMDPVRRRVIENAIRDFRLGGAELVSPARERYAQIQERLAALGQKFSENVLDATNAFTLVVTDEAEIVGLPPDAREAARDAAARQGQPGWRFGLQLPSYLPVMQYAHRRDLRERLYRAYGTRASAEAVAPADAAARAALDNAPLIDELLALRAEEAHLLGYGNFAEVSLVPKMAESPEAVIAFLRDLAARARPFAERDLADLQRHAGESLGLYDLKAWDQAYVSEKLKESRYAFSDAQVKQYFQLPRVLEGLFSLVGRLFGVSVIADQAETWHPDVRFFRIEQGGSLVGRFYLDPYARESKRPGAWMDSARSRAILGRLHQKPVAYLVCNFQAPVGDRPALLTHDELTTLFHEFGHGLHHLLTRVDEIAVSGISGVEWDAVELPSQFMENFCWEWDNLVAMSAHVDTGEPLPREVFDRMLAAKNFQAGMQTLRQIEFALFDMLLHSSFQPGGTRDVQDLLDAVREEVAVVIPPRFNRFQNSFSHIFAGGYSAGYYSYKWAEVLSADAYAAFEEAAAEPDSATALVGVGRRFLDEILAVGGSRPAIDSFRAFRGRDPSLDPLLRHNGMIDESRQEDAHA